MMCKFAIAVMGATGIVKVCAMWRPALAEPVAPKNSLSLRVLRANSANAVPEVGKMERHEICDDMRGENWIPIRIGAICPER